VTNLNLAQVNILDAVRVLQPDWSRLVIEGEVDGATYPLLMVGSMEGRRIAALTFDIRRSDLPLQVAFPILLANLGDWLSPGRSGELPDQVPPGGAVPLSLPPEVYLLRYSGRTRAESIYLLRQVAGYLQIRPSLGYTV
jgi:Ca-activated chloride channel homolog